MLLLAALLLCLLGLLFLCHINILIEWLSSTRTYAVMRKVRLLFHYCTHVRARCISRARMWITFVLLSLQLGRKNFQNVSALSKIIVVLRLRWLGP